MANATQDSLFESFTEVAGGLTKNLQGFVSAITGSTSSNPAGTTVNSSSQASSESSGARSVLSIATTVLESGLGVVPLIAGLIGLFGGGDSATPPPLVHYAMPAAMRFDYANTSSGASSADYDQFGMPRVMNSQPGNQTAANASPSSPQVGTAAPQINVHVQTMDSKSFLDHSSEIAQAVRAAMLNLSSINDVVSDL